MERDEVRAVVVCVVQWLAGCVSRRGGECMRGASEHAYPNGQMRRVPQVATSCVLAGVRMRSVGGRGWW